jgi:UDP-N-acetylglucosamine diphosphorylase/glucosamine-1-phosphate N-acetyltransferase
MSIILSDAGHHASLRPLTFTRPVAQIRPGILRLSEGWYVRSGLGIGYRTEQYLQEAFPPGNSDPPHFEVDATVFPTDAIVSAVMDLRPGQVLVHTQRPIAFAIEGNAQLSIHDWHTPPAFWKRVEFPEPPIRFERTWHLFQRCGDALVNDFKLLTEGRRSAPLSSLNTVISDPDLIFLEEGAVVEASVLNTKAGPIYIGNGAEVMEGSMIRGPFALGDHAQLKMGAKIYGPTSIGPESRVGGEVNNSVIFGFSNKAHDGFLGNSVIGEWCNLGADTNNSNLKNTYGPVQLYDHGEQRMVDTGLQFCGLIMGDHSKCGINTMFNTGTVVDVACNIYGADIPPKRIESFSWGGADGFAVYEFEKAMITARRVMERRHVPLTEIDERILRHVYHLAGRT